MKVVLLTNFWYVRGGLERVVFADADGLAARGHEVIPFASAHALNEPTPFSTYFPPAVDHGALGSGMAMMEKARTALRLFHSRPAADAFEALVRRTQPDLVHQHGLARQFSPSVLERAHAMGLPTALTIHDYSLRCPSGDLSRPGVAVCLETSCAGHRYDRAVRFACVHGSRTASALAAAELLVTRALRRYERAVDLFLTPSQYVADRMRESGLPASRLRVLPNAIAPGPEGAAGDGDHVLAYGRLVPHKGFRLVVELARRLPGIPFVIAGDGPDRVELERRAEGLSNVTFTGFVDETRVAELVRGARLVVVPSEWPEPFGMVVLEAWREGRPVVAAASGALPELIEHEQTGLLFEPADVHAATAAVVRVWDEPKLARRLGMAGRKEVATTYAFEMHLDRLEETYRQLTSNGRSTNTRSNAGATAR